MSQQMGHNQVNQLSEPVPDIRRSEAEEQKDPQPENDDPVGMFF